MQDLIDTLKRIGEAHAREFGIDLENATEYRAARLFEEMREAMQSYIDGVEPPQGASYQSWFRELLA